MSVTKIKKMFPEKTKIRLHCMKGEINMPSGLNGTVSFVDDIGQIHVNWENGSTLALNVGIDDFYLI